MHIHLRIHHWVLWWFYIGVVVGIVALVNIFFRNLTRTQDHVVLLVGLINWVLGGIVCWAFDGITIHKLPESKKQDPKAMKPKAKDQEREWHPASDFLFPGRRYR